MRFILCVHFTFSIMKESWKKFLYYDIVKLMFYNKYVINILFENNIRTTFIIKNIFLLAFKLLRDCRSHNLGLNFAQSDTLTLSSYKNSIKLRMILISFIHITDKKRNITRKYGESCYTKYRVHQCNGNIGITFCTRARVTKLYTTFVRVPKKYIPEIENE